MPRSTPAVSAEADLVASHGLAWRSTARLDRGVNPMKCPAIALIAILLLALPSVFAAEPKAKGKAAAKAAKTEEIGRAHV